MKKILVMGLSAAIVLSSAGCAGGGSGHDNRFVSQESSTSSAVEKDGFNFADYLGDEIIDIQKVAVSEPLDAKCETYRFIFLSDMEKKYKIKGFISIPVSCIETRKPCQCMVFCNGGNSNLGYLDKSDTAM